MERWKRIKRHDGYWVSSFGNLYSEKTNRVWKGHLRLDRARPKAPRYYYVTFPPKATYPVATLVAEAFLGKRPSGMEVNHKDGNTKNNKATNLEWVTHSENQKHVYEVLGKPGGRRSKTNWAPKVEKLLAKGMTGTEIAKRLGISTTVVTRIKLKKYWGNSPTGYGLRNEGKCSVTNLALNS